MVWSSAPEELHNHMHHNPFAIAMCKSMTVVLRRASGKNYELLLKIQCFRINICELVMPHKFKTLQIKPAVCICCISLSNSYL